MKCFVKLGDHHVRSSVFRRRKKQSESSFGLLMITHIPSSSFTYTSNVPHTNPQMTIICAGITISAICRRCCFLSVVCNLDCRHIDCLSWVCALFIYCCSYCSLFTLLYHIVRFLVRLALRIYPYLLIQFFQFGANVQ